MLRALSLAFEFLFGIGRFDLVQFRVDVGIDRREPQLLGALQQDFIGDQAAQNLQLLRLDLVFVGALGLLLGLRFVNLIELGVGDGVAVDRRGDAGGRLATARELERARRAPRSKGQKMASLAETPLYSLPKSGLCSCRRPGGARRRSYGQAKHAPPGEACFNLPRAICSIRVEEAR